MRYHTHDGLKNNEYLTEQDPLNLWKSLKDRYDHLKIVILCNAQNEFFELEVLDFFQDENGEPVSNKAFNIMLGNPPTSV